MPDSSLSCVSRNFFRSWSKYSKTSVSFFSVWITSCSLRTHTTPEGTRISATVRRNAFGLAMKRARRESLSSAHAFATLWVEYANQHSQSNTQQIGKVCNSAGTDQDRAAEVQNLERLESAAQHAECVELRACACGAARVTCPCAWADCRCSRSGLKCNCAGALAASLKCARSVQRASPALRRA
eukprot:121956-Pleurochrysis_carterae.AAC.4